jgi:hypothetical protein
VSKEETLVSDHAVMVLAGFIALGCVLVILAIGSSLARLVG